MRPKSFSLSLVVLCFFAPGLVNAASSKGGCDFPPGLRDEVSKEFPSKSLVSLADLSEYDRKIYKKDHGTRCPGIVRVDFYGDGKPTWALVLIGEEAPTRKAHLVVAHQAGSDWELRSLETTDGLPVVWRQEPRKYGDVYGKETIRATRPVVVFCRYESWAILYSWTGTK